MEHILHILSFYNTLTISSTVVRALLSSEVNTWLTSMPESAMASAAVTASASPSGERSTSTQPQNLLKHSSDFKLKNFNHSIEDDLF